jgi:hypothetical protein
MRTISNRLQRLNDWYQKMRPHGRQGQKPKDFTPTSTTLSTSIFYFTKYIFSTLQQKNAFFLFLFFIFFGDVPRNVSTRYWPLANTLATRAICDTPGFSFVCVLWGDCG